MSKLDSEFTPASGRTVSRRTVNSIAWTVPAIAVVAAAPAASASTAYDVLVSGTAVSGTAAFIQIGPVPKLSFTITAQAGTVPAGTEFTLTSGGLINLTLLGAQLIGLEILNTNGNVATIALTSDLTVGSSRTIDILPAAALFDLAVLQTATLALSGSDSPATAPGAANSATIGALAVISVGGLLRSVVGADVL